MSCEVSCSTVKRMPPIRVPLSFVGNDRPDEDDRDNYHARRVVDILKRISPQFKCIIATSAASSEGIKALQRFQNGEGDVLVVKQMGGVGYDVPRLKVELDLSVVRTAASFVQRVARVARGMARGDHPDDVQMTAVYITPDDILGRRCGRTLLPTSTARLA